MWRSIVKGSQGATELWMLQRYGHNNQTTWANVVKSEYNRVTTSRALVFCWAWSSPAKLAAQQAPGICLLPLPLSSRVADPHHYVWIFLKCGSGDPNTDLQACMENIYTQSHFSASLCLFPNQHSEDLTRFILSVQHPSASLTFHQDYTFWETWVGRWSKWCTNRTSHQLLLKPLHLQY